MRKHTAMNLVVTGLLAALLALPAAAVLSVLVRFAYRRYLAEHPDAKIIAESRD